MTEAQLRGEVEPPRRADEIVLRIACRDTFEAHMANFADVVSSAPAA